MFPARTFDRIKTRRSNFTELRIYQCQISRRAKLLLSFRTDPYNPDGHLITQSCVEHRIQQIENNVQLCIIQLDSYLPRLVNNLARRGVDGFRKATLFYSLLL